MVPRGVSFLQDTSHGKLSEVVGFFGVNFNLGIDRLHRLVWGGISSFLPEGTWTQEGVYGRWRVFWDLVPFGNPRSREPLRTQSSRCVIGLRLFGLPSSWFLFSRRLIREQFLYSQRWFRRVCRRRILHFLGLGIRSRGHCDLPVSSVCRLVQEVPQEGEWMTKKLFILAVLAFIALCWDRNPLEKDTHRLARGGFFLS